MVLQRRWFHLRLPPLRPGKADMRMLMLASNYIRPRDPQANPVDSLCADLRDRARPDAAGPAGPPRCQRSSLPRRGGAGPAAASQAGGAGPGRAGSLPPGEPMSPIDNHLRRLPQGEPGCGVAGRRRVAGSGGRGACPERTRLAPQASIEAQRGQRSDPRRRTAHSWPHLAQASRTQSSSASLARWLRLA